MINTIKRVQKNTPKDPKVKVQMILTESLIKRLEALAERETSSKSLLIRLACERYLAEREAAE